MLDEDPMKREARKRNLRISIVKGILDGKGELQQNYSRQEIQEFFRFRRSDLLQYTEDFFEYSEGVYSLKQELQDKAKKIIERHECAKEYLEKAQAVFEKTFGRFEDDASRKSAWRFDGKVLTTLYQETLKPIVLILHWGMLPILPECLMINSRRIPEDGVTEFYDHYHMLQALRREVLGEGEHMNMDGELTLDREMTFCVYSRRWGHEDVYGVKRTEEGWKFRFMSEYVSCRKDGTDALFLNLEHDCIFGPEEGVKYALENLWEEAEEGRLSFEELQKRLQQVADWISIVEKAVGAGQPEWVGYY